MVKYKITSEVNIGGLICRDTYTQEFDDDENVFGRVLIYHQRMYKVFPHREFRLICAEPVKQE